MFAEKQKLISAYNSVSGNLEVEVSKLLDSAWNVPQVAAQRCNLDEVKKAVAKLEQIISDAEKIVNE